MDVLDFAELRARGRRRGIDLGASTRPDFGQFLRGRDGRTPLECRATARGRGG
ncbi:hypothetical protein [Streptomyces sp. NPDC050535]|uniref:hypothetical protein n=1 Tax=Streptomyces sp. NPDC050535 TaxID=3365626 RepID=UPI0037882FD2